MRTILTDIPSPTSNNRFKGIAFIEYELPEEADRAVAGGNDLEIGGQKVSPYARFNSSFYNHCGLFCRLWLPFRIRPPSQRRVQAPAPQQQEQVQQLHHDQEINVAFPHR